MNENLHIKYLGSWISYPAAVGIGRSFRSRCLPSIGFLCFGRGFGGAVHGLLGCHFRADWLFEPMSMIGPRTSSRSRESTFFSIRFIGWIGFGSSCTGVHFGCFLMVGCVELYLITFVFQKVAVLPSSSVLLLTLRTTLEHTPSNKVKIYHKFQRILFDETAFRIWWKVYTLTS